MEVLFQITLVNFILCICLNIDILDDLEKEYFYNMSTTIFFFIHHLSFTIMIIALDFQDSMFYYLYFIRIQVSLHYSINCCIFKYV